MLAQRSLLLIIFVLFFFEPGLQKWMASDAGSWYRPYIAWLTVIAIVYFIQRWNEKRER